MPSSADSEARVFLCGFRLMLVGICVRERRSVDCIIFSREM